MLRKLNSKLPFVYSIGQTGDKFTTYSGYSQGIFSTGTVVTEVGTLVTRDASVAADPEKFVLNGTGVTAVATKSVNASNQYYLRIKKSSSGTVYTRSYIKYRYTPSVEVGSVTTGTLIQSIDYGNICQG
jgi:hypothetical protein